MWLINNQKSLTAHKIIFHAVNNHLIPSWCPSLCFSVWAPADIFCITLCWLSSVTAIPSGSVGKRRHTYVLCQACLGLQTGIGQMVRPWGGAAHTKGSLTEVINKDFVNLTHIYRSVLPRSYCTSVLVWWGEAGSIYHVLSHKCMLMYHGKKSLGARTLNDILTGCDECDLLMQVEQRETD